MDATKEKIVLENDKLVYAVCKNISNKYLFEEDLLQIGRIGLIKAANTFDEKRGYKFSTYACQIIKNEIFMYFRKDKRHNDTISINAQITAIDTENITLEDILVSDLTADGNMLLFDEINTLYKNLHQLKSFKTQAIIIHYFGLFYCKKLNQIELSDMFKISQAAVSRTIKKGLKELREIYNR